MQPGSLRIKPLEGNTITRVDVAPVKADRKQEKDLARLAERRDAISDRLRALDTREDIFRAAAKSQSGKAPRKTKNNPEPLANIRQGTEFAIAQLEEVYRARRKAEKELKALDARIASVRKAGNAGGSTARIWLTGRGNRVKASYDISGLAWTPRYDFRLKGDGQVEVVMHAVIPPVGKGVTVAVVPAPLAEGRGDAPLPAAPAAFATVATFRFPVEKERFSSLPPSSLSFSLKNAGQRKLPPGNASCFWQGEYLGSVKFPGVEAGGVSDLACGPQRAM
jgi:hypothetical protein